MKTHSDIILVIDNSFPFGQNIHFVFDTDSAQFIFTHSMLSWLIDEPINFTASELIQRLDAGEIHMLANTYQEVLAGTFTGSLKLKISAPEGDHWVLLHPLRIRYEGRLMIAGTVTDITAEVLNTELVTKFANKKNSILHMLGHDLRGPLNLAGSLVNAIEKENNEPEILRKSGAISSILRQSIDLISNLVSREADETAGALLIKKQVNIKSILNDYMQECRRSADLAKREFTLISSANTIMINLDQTKFMQVINNLLSNALKFTKPGGVIQVKVTDSPEEVLISFSDDGIGIPEHLLPGIFDKFTTSARRGLQGEPSVGLGLNISKTIVEWHAGTISCQSQEGKGTTFHLALPKSPRSDQ